MSIYFISPISAAKLKLYLYVNNLHELYKSNDDDNETPKPKNSMYIHRLNNKNSIAHKKQLIDYKVL